MDLMKHLIPRTDTTCASGKLWYVCTAGDYKGCCSTNPCTSGVCPDDDETTTSSTTTRTTTTSKSTSTSSDAFTLTSSSAENATTTTAQKTSSSVTRSTNTSTMTFATSTSTSSAAPVSPSSGNHSAIIGGVIGGMAAFLIIAVILFCFWKRSKRKKNSETNIIDQGQRPNPGNTPGQIGPARDYGNGPTYPNFESSVTDSPDNTIIRALTSGPSVSTTSLNLAGSASCVRTISAIPTAELLASVPKRPGYTPELPDVTARRMRAELSSDSQRGLINVPPNQRRGVMIQQPGGFANTLLRDSLELSSTSSSPNVINGSPYYGSGSVAGLASPSGSMSPRLMARNTARRVVTEEGIVMGANLDRYSEDPRIENAELSIEDWKKVDKGNCNGKEDGDADTTKRKENSWQSQDHVMSFMNFDGSLPLTDVSDAGYSHGDAEGPSPPISPPTSFSASQPISPPIPNRIGNMSFMDVGPLSPTSSEVPPAYEAGEEGTEFEVNGERKTPAGTTGSGVRRFH